MSITAPNEVDTDVDSQINSGGQASLVILRKSVADECSKHPEAVVIDLGLPTSAFKVPSK